MVAEANNLNLLKKIQKSQIVSGLKIYDPLENYFFFNVEKENINPMLTKRWQEAKSQLQTLCLFIFSWHNPSRNVTRNLYCQEVTIIFGLQD